MTSFIRFGIVSTMLGMGTSICDAEAGFVETFSGTGPFSSTGDVLDGFDNPGWRHDGDGKFRDGGLWFENPVMFVDAGDSLERSLEWKVGFVATVEIREHVLTERPRGSALISFWQALGAGRNELNFLIGPNNDSPDSYVATMKSGSIEETQTVERGPHILLSIAFDEDASQATYRYDNNLDDDVSPVTLAILHYSGTVREELRTGLIVDKLDAGQADALVDNWTFSPFSFTGDFNANGIFDAEDIDLLNAEIRRGTNDPEFDLVEDGLVNEFDRNHWVHSLNNTYFGDSNLDGEFNSADLVSVFQAGRYENGMEAGWAEGDWSGDGLFESGDLVVAFQDGGYEHGPRAANVVPEPSSPLLLVLGLLVASVVRSRT